MEQDTKLMMNDAVNKLINKRIWKYIKYFIKIESEIKV